MYLLNLLHTKSSQKGKDRSCSSACPSLHFMHYPEKACFQTVPQRLTALVPNWSPLRMEKFIIRFAWWIFHLDIKYYRTEKSILGTFCLQSILVSCLIMLWYYWNYYCSILTHISLLHYGRHAVFYFAKQSTPKALVKFKYVLADLCFFQLLD